jgi:hypothetical protein
MKKIKYLLLIIIVLLFSGCSGNYDLTLNKDLTVDEKLDLYVLNKSDVYERTYQMLEEAGISEDDYNIVIIDDKMRITYNQKYDSFEDYYLNSNLYRVLFEGIEYSKDNKGMSISASSVLKLDDEGNHNIINSYEFEDLKINIKSPFKVNKSNADEIKDNTYTWNLNSNDTYMNIRVDYSYKNNNSISIVMLILVGIASFIIIGYVVTYLIRNKRI